MRSPRLPRPRHLSGRISAIHLGVNGTMAPAGAQRDFLRGTLAPFLRASERPIAIACFRLLTRPPLPPFPDRKVPRFRRRIADLTDFCAPLPYRGMSHLVANVLQWP